MLHRCAMTVLAVGVSTTLRCERYCLCPVNLPFLPHLMQTSLCVVQGPICRLLVSCRALTADNSKVALFCCLAGTHLTSTGKPWTTAHWQQFLLILHVAKRLVGGLWKNVLKDWASAAGARLPLQCAHDLLGNLYNASSIAQLERLPALLHTRSRLLNPSSRSASRPATAQTPAAVQGSPTDLGSPSPRSLAPGLGGSELVPRPASAVERGSVAAALAELVVDGPVGPAVDLDDLMNMLMQQFDTGEDISILHTARYDCGLCNLPIVEIPVYSRTAW